MDIFSKPCTPTFHLVKVWHLAHWMAAGIRWQRDPAHTSTHKPRNPSPFPPQYPRLSSTQYPPLPSRSQTVMTFRSPTIMPFKKTTITSPSQLPPRFRVRPALSHSKQRDLLSIVPFPEDHRSVLSGCRGLARMGQGRQTGQVGAGAYGGPQGRCLQENW